MPYAEIQKLIEKLAYRRQTWVEQARRQDVANIASLRKFHSEESFMAKCGCIEIVEALNANMTTGVDPAGAMCAPVAGAFGEQIDAFLGSRDVAKAVA